MWVKKEQYKGFTIVELLIVIVVIAILAAISIVAFNGIQNRARASAASSALSQVGKKLALWQIESGTNGSSSADCNVFATQIGSTVDPQNSCNSTKDGITYQYRQGAAGTSNYCLTATNGTVSYKLDTTASGSPTAGGCAGHGIGGAGAVTNYAMNPGANSSTIGLSSAGGGVATRNIEIASDRSRNGTAFKLSITGSGQVAGMAQPPTNGLLLSSGEQLSWSFWVYSTKAGILSPYMQGVYTSNSAYAGANGGNNIAIPANTWTKVTGTATAPANMYVNEAGAYNLSVVSGDVVWFDEFMLTKGSTLYEYSDGNSPSWIWNGTPNASTSTGPAI